MNEQLHLDRDKALQWLEGDDRMMARIRTIFMKNIPSQVEMLGACLNQGDAGSAERMAHIIMGSAAMMGATIMSNEAGRIEQSAIKGDLDSARLHFAHFAVEYEQVMKALKAYGDGE